MTKWNVSFTVWFFATFAPFSAFAAAPAPSIYVWNNTKGFVSASSCEAGPSHHVPFHIAQKPNSDLNSSSKFKGQGFLNKLFSGVLLDRSLIALRGVLSNNPQIQIRVLSVPHNAHKSALTNIANAGEEGTIDKESLQDVGNFVIEVTDVPKLLKTTKAPFDAKKTFWQTTMEDNQYTILKCAEGPLMMEYVVFDVYNTTNINPIAQVGLRYDQTEILNSINVYTPDEANQAVAPGDPVNSDTPNTPPATGGGGGSSTTPPPENGGTQTPPTTPPGEGGTGTTPGAPVTDGRLEYVICTDEPDVDVLDPELKKVLFKADQFETIIPIQSWDEKQKSAHIEVQFPGRADGPKSGWIARSLVQLKGDCKELLNDSEGGSGDSNNDVDMRDVVLNTKDCCKFPTIKRPTHSYAIGTPRFRAQRARGRRLHAGCDLYRKRGETAVAVASGIITRGLYYFYQGVFAIEIRHPKFVARYGEILGSASPGIAKGKIVKAGQEIGKIGKVSSGCCLPMLHFELYKGTTVGSLTRYRRPPYDRRSDLMDPTPLLRQWEKTQYGHAY